MMSKLPPLTQVLTACFNVGVWPNRQHSKLALEDAPSHHNGSTFRASQPTQIIAHCLEVMVQCHARRVGELYYSSLLAADMCGLS